jgi:glutathione S-transferase
MKIIETRPAPNPRRVRVFLAEKGIDLDDIEFEDIKLMQLEHKEDSFGKFNPRQRVPVLVLDDGTVICESVSICRYFEEIQPEPVLMGSGAVGKATVDMWQRWVELDLLGPISQVFRHTNERMAVLEDPQFPDWGEANRRRVKEFLGFLDGALADKPFIAGEEYSIADITGLIAVDFLGAASMERPPELKNLARWYEDVSSRPSAKA